MLELHFKELIYQLALFVGLFFLLKKLLFNPLIITLNRRDNRIKGSLKEAEKLNSITLAREEEYKSIFSKERSKILQDSESLLNEARKESEEMIRAASLDAEKKFADAKSDILKEATEVENAVRAKINSFSSLITKKFLLFFVFLISSPLLFASEEQPHGSGLAVIWSIINFSLFVLLMYFLLRKLVVSAMKAREEQILSNIKKAEALLTSAREQKSEIEQRFQNLDSDLLRLKNEIRARIGVERESILKEARTAAQKLGEDCTQFIKSEVVKSKKRLREKIATEIIENAENHLRLVMDKPKNEKMISRYLNP